MRTFAPLLFATALLAGCLGSAVGPGLPATVLAEHGWEAIGAPDDRTYYGVAQVRAQQYAPRESHEVARVMVLSATDVPFVDENDFLPDAIAQLEAAQGVRFVPTGTEPLTLPHAGGAQVEAQVFDVEGAPVPTGAILVSVQCDEPNVFLAAAGYGARPGGLLGSADYFGEAQELVASVACEA